MEGAQVRIPLAKLYEALRAKGNKRVKELVVAGLQEMADRHQVKYELVGHLVDDVVEKIYEEQQRFNPKLPYPPATANNMSIQVEMPTRGKIGVAEFNTKIDV